jgi:hypothetical protein
VLPERDRIVEPAPRKAGSRLWLVLVLGIVTTGFGIAYAAATAQPGQDASLLNQILSGLLISVGGGVVGASISLIVTTNSDRDVLHQMREVVEKSLTSTLVSDEDSLVPVRRPWHHYFVGASATTSTSASTSVRW